MKNLSSAVLLLLASAWAVAADKEVASVVLAYNDTSAPLATEASPEHSKQRAERVLANTLDVVSASLSVELDNFDAPTLPGAPKSK